MKELNLKEYLKKYSGKEIDFFRFNGNYGDSLIWHGTMKLLSGLNITINFVESTSNIKNDVLFIDGGGNFVDYYSDVRDFLKNKHHIYKKIIILPHTINGRRQKKILSELNKNCTIFCREKISYEFVNNSNFSGKLYLWHDCAFYNDFSEFIKIGKGVLNAFRQDCESIMETVPKDNVDISANSWCKKPLKSFLNKINNYREIRTDRLHVAIAASLLQKKVLFFQNSYYKNMAVYDYSLEGYSNVIFIYKSNMELITQKNISRVFSSYYNIKPKSKNILNLFYQIINTNYKIWKLEDTVRDSRQGIKTRIKAKVEIDKTNQYRNDTITKIDINFSFLLNNIENSVNDFVSESPGSLIDRLSILYIRKHELEKLLKIIIEDKVLLKTYQKKIKNVNNQIKYLEIYLKNFIIKIKNKKVFFKIFEPIKIYNDPQIKKYINLLNKT